MEHWTAEKMIGQVERDLRLATETFEALASYLKSSGAEEMALKTLLVASITGVSRKRCALWLELELELAKDPN